MEQLSHAPFIWGAYIIASVIFVTLGVVKWQRAKRLEAEADRLKADLQARRAKS